VEIRRRPSVLQSARELPPRARATEAIVLGRGGDISRTTDAPAWPVHSPYPYPAFPPSFFLTASVSRRIGRTARSLGRPAACFAARSAFASATSVFSEMSEDIPAVVPARNEHGPTRGRQEQTAHDQAQIARIHAWKLRRQARADVPDPAGEHVNISRPSAARPVAPCCGALGRAPASPTSPSHLCGIHVPDYNPNAWVCNPSSAPDARIPALTRREWAPLVDHRGENR
jgi:hypothetical protein